MKTLRITLFAALVAAFFTGCVGPEGPAGTNGTNGYDGAPGVTGTNAVFASNPSDWSPAVASGYNFLIAGYNVSIITQDAINTGVVMVYFESGSGTWSPLPYTYPLSASNEQTLSFNYSLGLLTLQMQNSDNTVPVAPSSATNYNVVVIPTSVIKQHPGFNFKDYAMVKQLMNIK